MRVSKALSISFALLAVAATALAGPKHLKMRIAVAPLDWSDHDYVDNIQIPVEFRNAINEKLIQKLMDTGKFVVLEREAMEALLTEKGIKTENTGQTQKGKIVPAQALIKGKLTDFELQNKGGGGNIGIGNFSIGGRMSEARVGINVRMFDVDTSEMIADESAERNVTAHSVNVGASINSVSTNWDAFARTPLGEATTKALDDAVKKITTKLEDRPWSASVADWDGTAKEVTINSGSDLGVQVGDTFDVYRVTKVIKDPETGEVLGKKTARIGSVRVTSVEKKFAIAAATDGTDFNVGDVVKEVR